MDILNQQLASNSMVSKPSDNPFAAEAILRYQKQVEENAQYQKNADNAISFLETSFDAVDNIIITLTDLRVLIVAALNASDTDQLKTYGNEADSLIRQLVDLGNTKFNNKYVFGGTATGTVPFTYGANGVVELTAGGTTGDIFVDIGGIELEKINISAAEIFKGEEVFRFLEGVRDVLLTGNNPVQAHLAQIDVYLNLNTEHLGKIGAVTARFHVAASQMGREEIRLKDYLGNEKDIDLADLILKMTQMQTNLQAAFKSWSDVLQKTLFNFLEY
jgi:flagellar hook-associated protein 3 FlgL